MKQINSGSQRLLSTFPSKHFPRVMTGTSNGCITLLQPSEINTVFTRGLLWNWMWRGRAAFICLIFFSTDRLYRLSPSASSWKMSNYLIAVDTSLVRVVSCAVDKDILESGSVVYQTATELLYEKPRNKKLGLNGLCFIRKGSFLSLSSSECHCELYGMDVVARR